MSETAAAVNPFIRIYPYMPPTIPDKPTVDYIYADIYLDGENAPDADLVVSSEIHYGVAPEDGARLEAADVSEMVRDEAEYKAHRAAMREALEYIYTQRGFVGIDVEDQCEMIAANTIHPPDPGPLA